ncbi:hypothetical protein [uncultured Aminobacterium sp.]|uniref:hypothetical protein n=1 Tax=uncultured Aminobacterium sp. TaxID=548265 RepID=UPI0025998BDE|nr:hypothetical protein [uncultured Aminobacterium sp.]
MGLEQGNRSRGVYPDSCHGCPRAGGNGGLDGTPVGNGGVEMASIGKPSAALAGAGWW